ncbi:MAG: hypothetical protein LPD71_05040 [Shewanella sp.]|nr:hypothetical protein [Shewanella sp.]MCF1431435.1 hypothetical protein [Shewanella sp.]MCF1438128.1 hypothetical protein [Shewanella sp.]MCF1457379.1 hypothetical protein [Shewanella sp.]
MALSVARAAPEYLELEFARKPERCEDLLTPSLSIVLGVALGQFFPLAFEAVVSLEYASVNLTIAVPALPDSDQ